jgi:hypothetical protein
MRNLISCLLVAVVLPCAAADSKAVLWRQPGRLTTADWTWGPGGEARAPRAPFEYVEEDFKGTNPKIKVRDANGQHWTVKFGGEGHSDVFATRLLFAVGYEAQASYFVRSGMIAGVHDLKRAKPFLGKRGEFAYARFKLHDSKRVTRVDGMDWSWTENPFVGTHELNGLKILMMLMSNWDAKDARDGKGSNTAIYSKSGPGEAELSYAFDDWGATFGKWGGFFSRDKWDAQGYSAESRVFVSTPDGRTIRWGYRGKHGSDLTKGIGIEDVRWLLTYLNGVTDEDLRAGLLASGATNGDTEIFARAIRGRITQLQHLCDATQAAR